MGDVFDLVYGEGDGRCVAGGAWVTRWWWGIAAYRNLAVSDVYGSASRIIDL